MRLSSCSHLLDVVVPTLNEEAALPSLLEDLGALTVPHRIFVADSGSSDRTRDLAEGADAMVVHSVRGRALQMNAGAAKGKAPWILFLHADSRLSPVAARALECALRPREDAPVAAYFRFRLEGRGWFWRFIELGQSIREHVSGLVYGDQGLLVSRTAFEEVDGFPKLPLMEDVEIVRRLRNVGRVKRLPAHLGTSPRRYEGEGRWRAWIRNSLLMGLYLVGVPASRLAQFYEPERRSLRSDRNPVLLIFAKAPRPGTVKSRLAVELGEARAAELYRSMGRQVIDQVRGGPFRVVVCYDPPDAEPEVANWLGRHGLEFWPQSTGDLGARMSDAGPAALAFRRHALEHGTGRRYHARPTPQRRDHPLRASDTRGRRPACRRAGEPPFR
jgi:rSAM/selenodomain-associated transferase 2